MNKVCLIGRLTKDVDLRQTQSGKAVAGFTLAVNRSFVREGEERQADFISIVAWGKTAEFCSSYFKKGQQVAVVGRIQTRTWDDNNGQKRYATEVIADEVFFADSKRGDQAQQPTAQPAQPAQPVQPEQGYQAQVQPQQQPEPQQQTFDMELSDDEVPF